MTPMKPVRLALGTLLAADATKLAPVADANKIALIKAPFAVDENLTPAGLAFADFTGSTPLEGATGTQTTGIDPATLDQVIQIVAPLGGYRWETTDTVNLPQTIYGFALLNNALDTLLAVEALVQPITLQDADQFIEIDPVRLTLVAQPIS